MINFSAFSWFLDAHENKYPHFWTNSWPLDVITIVSPITISQQLAQLWMSWYFLNMLLPQWSMKKPYHPMPNQHDPSRIWYPSHPASAIQRRAQIFSAHVFSYQLQEKKVNSFWNNGNLHFHLLWDVSDMGPSNWQFFGIRFSRRFSCPLNHGDRSPISTGIPIVAANVDLDDFYHNLTSRCHWKEA